MMKKLFAIAAVIVLGSASAVGQSSIQDKVNKIKAQQDVYFWDEYTHPDPDTAAVNSARWVLLSVNVERENQLSLDDIMPYVKHIKMKRGNLTRAFAYLKKTDVPADGWSGASVAGVPDATPSAPPVSPSAPITSPSASASVASAPSAQTYQPDDFVRKILQYKNFWDVYNFLEHKRIEGQVAQFGPLKDVDDYSSMDLILFDMQSREVITVLSAASSTGERINLTTGNTDSLDGYPQDMLLVIWYIKY